MKRYAFSFEQCPGMGEVKICRFTLESHPLGIYANELNSTSPLQMPTDLFSGDILQTLFVDQ